MKKLKVMAAACGLAIGLTGIAQAALSPSTTYTFTGYLTNYWGSDQTVKPNDTIKLTISTDSSSNLSILLYDTQNANNLNKLVDISTTDSSLNHLNPFFYTFYKNETTDETFVATYQSLVNNGVSIDVNNSQFLTANLNSMTTTPTPIPAAAWLLGSGLLGMVGLKRRKTTAA